MFDGGLLLRQILGLAGAEDGKSPACEARARTGTAGTELIVDCSRCKGRSSMNDPACREGILKSLAGKGGIRRLQLERDFVREYAHEPLDAILRMATFCEDVRLHASAFATYGCGRCDPGRENEVRRISALAYRDPLDAALEIKSLYSESFEAGRTGQCSSCIDRYAAFTGDLAILAREIEDVSYSRIVPYIRPRFSRSRILSEPPEGSAFLRSYEVEGGDGLSPLLQVSLYRLPDSLEKLYFIVPWEYAVGKEDLSVIVAGRERLLKRRPYDDGFMDPGGARAFFTRQAREAIVEAAREAGIYLDRPRLERLSRSFVKYTSGLGIIEDLLGDPHIQDVYVNAPVGMTPLHVVVDGEECTSNVYLSESDVDSMISRLRAISGRPFSEASPVLDMDLGEFHTRVSAIGSPLTRGLAYAFRRHKKTPWTLPQLVSRRMLSPYAAGLLSVLVDGQASMLITGSRGAGKTSLLTALMLEIARSYRILAIEDTPELPIEDMQRYGWKVQGIGTRAAVSGSEAEFQASDALRATLRLGDSAIVLGEVRGAEARSLYEAMRVGASGNSVMGTIHGASCKDVFERVVHDIGVQPASFRATDVVAVCSTVRPGGSVIRERRVTQVAEIVKSAGDDDPESAFNDLLVYGADRDTLSPADRIDTGRSEALQAIAVRWGLSLAEICACVTARGELMRAVAAGGAVRPDVMEAPMYARCMDKYRACCEAVRRERGTTDYDQALASWRQWLSTAGRESR
ncbi:ATPase, T2SS/T4P/T4SS family [Methanocella sp. MCL-LM]|uniref:ATPase, T2SS/T4P/T4SS family n=1 Tax=Methanocella sp. MCL-LM TaxID=3412035 RepID=UPI003C70AA1F